MYHYGHICTFCALQRIALRPWIIRKRVMDMPISAQRIEVNALQDYLKEFSDTRTEFPIIQTETIESLPSKTAYRICKRVFDFSFSLLALLILLVPMTLIYLLVLIDSGSPAIYRQQRLGQNEKPFVIYKFRTMRCDAEERGPRWAERDDKRCTRVGRILRSSRMDELPQLWNILRGDMSFVGPRPERPEFYDLFDAYIKGYRQRMLVPPGLTGLAQVSGGYDLLPEEKIVYDLEYIKNRSLWLDLKCIIKTIHIVAVGGGAR